MDETERLIGLWSREGHTASAIIAAHQLMQLSDEESCSNSSHGSNRSSRAVKGQSKGSDHPSQSKVTSAGKAKPKAALDPGGPLRQRSVQGQRSSEPDQGDVDGESKNQGGSRSRRAVEGQSKGSDHPSQSKATSAGKAETKAALDGGGPLRPQKKRKYRSIVEIYAETDPVDARIGDDH